MGQAMVELGPDQNNDIAVSPDCRRLSAPLDILFETDILKQMRGQKGEAFKVAQAAPLHNALSIFVALLAVPLVRRLPLIRAASPPITAALLIGSVVAVATALAPPVGLGMEQSVIASLAPKSAKAAVAVGISERLGGFVRLAAMIAVLTGLFGAMVGPSLLAAFGARDERAVGFAIGVAAHAIGTARAFQISVTAG